MQSEGEMTRREGRLHVVAAMIVEGERVLLARRIRGRLKGFWEFPGGKVRESEDAVAALKREIHEELGLEITVKDCLGSYKHNYEHLKINLEGYICERKAGTAVARVHDQLRWVDIAGLSACRLAEADIPLAKALAERRTTRRS